MADILLPQATITGLPRGLHEGKVLQLTQINYLFGANGSGKSLSLKCISNQAKSKIREKGLQPTGYFAQYITASIQPSFYQDQYPMLDRLASDYDLDNADISGQAFYQHLQDYPEIAIKVRDALQKYLGRYPNVARKGVNIAMSYLREEEDIPAYSPQQESDGLKRLSLLLGYIYHPKCKFLAIDEPEVYLHPDMISFLLDEITTETGNGKQFVIVTHSPEIIRIGKSDIFSYIYFNLKNTLAATHIIQANEVGATQIIEKLGFLLDVNRRAFLFAPVTLFVEGLDDEYIYNKLKDLEKVLWSRRIFMVNTGGVSNMYDFWKLWNLFDKDSRVIIDSPKNSKKQESVNIEINKFCKEFSIDGALSLDDKKIQLEPHKVFIAPYEDVLHFGEIYVKTDDFDGTLSKLVLTDHVSTLKKALQVEEPKKKQIRKEEKEWLVDLAKEVLGETLGQDGDENTLQIVKDQLEAKHPNIKIILNENEEYLISIYFQVSKDRRLFIKLAKLTLSNSLFGVE